MGARTPSLGDSRQPDGPAEPAVPPVSAEPVEPIPAGVDRACFLYATSQLADLDGHVSSIVDRLVARMPALQDISDDLREEMVTWLRTLTGAVMRILLTGQDFDRLSPMIEEVSRRRKSLGIEQAQTMRSSRYGQQALLDHAREYFRGQADEADLMAQLTPRLMEYQHVMTLSVARGYADGPEPAELADRQEQVQLLLDVLTGRATGAEVPATADLARTLGIKIPPKMVTVSVPAGAGVVDQARIIARTNPWSVVGAFGDRIASLSLRTPNAFPEPRGVAALPGDATAAQISRAVAAASAAADVAARLRAPELTVAQAAPFSAVLALPASDRDAYVESCFGDLPANDRGRSLLVAVSAALSHSRLADAAGALHVHRHTLDYRLRRFSDQTSLDLNDPSARLRCMLALFLIGLFPVLADDPGQ